MFKYSSNNHPLPLQSQFRTPNRAAVDCQENASNANGSSFLHLVPREMADEMPRTGTSTAAIFSCFLTLVLADIVHADFVGARAASGPCVFVTATSVTC